MRSNCLVYAFVEHRREKRAWVAAGRPAGMDPKIQVRESRLYPHWVPHFEVAVPVAPWSNTYVTRGFVPTDKSPLRWWQLWRLFWFKGYVERNTGAEGVDGTG